MSVTPGASAAGKLVPTPAHLHHYLRDWTNLPQCWQHATGHILVQLFEHAHYKIHYLVFDLDAPLDLVFTEEKSVVHMQFMLDGNMSCLLHQAVLPTLFENETYRLLYVPAGASVNSLRKGRSESMHFEFNDHYPQLFAKEFPPIDILAQLLLTDSDLSFIPAILPMSYQVLDTIRGELFTLKKDYSLPDRQKYIIYKLFWRYMIELKEQQKRENDPRGYEQVIERIKEEIRQAPNKAIQTNDYFAKKHLLTVGTLLRVFNLYSDVSLAAYRHEHCMLLAIHLRNEQGLTLEAIAIEIGYGSKSSLSTALKFFERKSKPE
jgi:AraC-like DNA-binding protein